jgi:hypothetical protein
MTGPRGLSWQRYRLATLLRNPRCVCGHSEEEHGGDPLYPSCVECECIHYEPEEEHEDDG